MPFIILYIYTANTASKICIQISKHDRARFSTTETVRSAFIYHIHCVPLPQYTPSFRKDHMTSVKSMCISSVRFQNKKQTKNMYQGCLLFQVQSWH